MKEKKNEKFWIGRHGPRCSCLCHATMAGNTDVTKQVLIANPTACCLAGDTRRIKHGKCDFTATAANLAYCVFTLAAGVFAIALRFWIGEAVMPTIAGDYLADFCSDGPYSGACFGMMATYRISLALTLFFVIHAVATLFVRSLHYTLWILKLPLAVVLFVGCFALPNEFYVVYYYFEAVGAFLFVSVVIVEFVDFTFGIQTWFAMKLLTWNGAAHIALSITYLGATVITNALWIAGIVTMYFFFSKCPLQLTFLITTTIINLALVVLSLLIEVLWCAWNPTGDDVEEEDRKWPCETKTSSGVMPAAVISLFNVTYTYMSLVSEPSEECNPFANAQQLAPVTLTLMYQALIIWCVRVRVRVHCIVLPGDEAHAVVAASRVGACIRNPLLERAALAIAPSAFPPFLSQCLQSLFVSYTQLDVLPHRECTLQLLLRRMQRRGGGGGGVGRSVRPRGARRTPN